MKKFVIICLLCLLWIPAQVLADSPEIHCEKAILIDADNGRVLFEKNAYAPAYPASTTKIMTAILTLENANLTDTVQASYQAVMSVPVGGSNAAIQVGETFTVEELLKVMLIASANESANILAEHVGGSIESFASMMNTKAQELGCKNTHFVNANGLHDESHYSCAYDLAIMYQYAWNHFPVFQSIESTVQYRLPTTETYSKDDRVFVNSNRMLIPSTGSDHQNYYYEYTTGGKTGYTSQAKNCLVASATKNNFHLIAVVLGGVQDENGVSYRFTDTKSLFEYGFSNLAIKTIVEKDTVADTLVIPNAPSQENRLPVVYADSLVISVDLKDVTNTYSPTIQWNEEILAPIEEGSVLGTATYTIYDTNYTVPLVAKHAVAEQTFSILGFFGNALKGFLILLVILVILVLIIRFYNKVIRKKRRRKALFKINRYNARFH